MLQAKNNSYVNQTIWINHTLSSFNNFSLFALLNFSFLLTVNRFVVIILPKCNILFESAKLYFLIIFIWLLTLAFSTIDYYFCIRSFHVSDLHWIRDCTKRPKSIFTSIHYIWSSVSPIVMFIMYIAMFYNIRRKRQPILKIQHNQNSSMSIKRKLNMARNNIYERSMLVQAALTCGVFEIKLIIVYLLPPLIIKIFGEGAHIPLRIFINCYIIFIYAALPTIYFLCNNRARRILKHHFFQLRHQHLNDQFVELKDQHFKDQHVKKKYNHCLNL
ncbi:putative integral membrane protein [Brugia pahangi]